MDLHLKKVEKDYSHFQIVTKNKRHFNYIYSELMN